MVRYFYSTAAGTPLEAEGRTFTFSPLSIHGGRINGIYETGDRQEIAILERVVDQRKGVTSMTEEDAEKAKKKLANPNTYSASSQPESPRLVAQPPMLDPSSNAASVGSAAPANRADTGEITVPKVISMARVGRHGSPQPLVSEQDRMLRSKLGK